MEPPVIDLCDSDEECVPPSPLVADEEEEDVASRCAVCFRSMVVAIREGSRQLAAAGCGHVFCQPCLDDWLSRRHTCPKCGAWTGAGRPLLF